MSGNNYVAIEPTTSSPSSTTEKAIAVQAAYNNLGDAAEALGVKAHDIGAAVGEIVRSLEDVYPEHGAPLGDSPMDIRLHQAQQQVVALTNSALNLLQRKVPSLSDTRTADPDSMVRLVDLLENAIEAMAAVQAGEKSLDDATPAVVALQLAVDGAEAWQFSEG